ncbi:MAG: hypothetical protein AB8B74_06450 [Crocinitomicaceae bacterium]
MKDKKTQYIIFTVLTVAVIALIFISVNSSKKNKKLEAKVTEKTKEIKQFKTELTATKRLVKPENSKEEPGPKQKSNLILEDPLSKIKT